MPSWLILVISIGSILFVGAILLVIGIMGENISRLRNINVELKGEIKHLQEKNNELEKELMKYDKKRKKEKEKGRKKMNKIYITGRITKDIELKGNENKFLSNTIAVYDGKDKNNQDITYFFDFKAFNYCANKLSSQAQKGSKIAIEGVLKQDKWEDENGKHSKVVIYAESVEIIQEFKQEKVEEVKEADPFEDAPF